MTSPAEWSSVSDNGWEGRQVVKRVVIGLVLGVVLALAMGASALAIGQPDGLGDGPPDIIAIFTDDPGQPYFAMGGDPTNRHPDVVVDSIWVNRPK